MNVQVFIFVIVKAASEVVGVFARVVRHLTFFTRQFSTPLVASPTTVPDCHAGVLISIPFPNHGCASEGSPAMRRLAALDG